MKSKRKVGKIEFVDKTKKVVKWYTFPGGPILVGPAEILKQIYRVSVESKNKAIKLLADLIKRGVVKKEGISNR